MFQFRMQKIWKKIKNNNVRDEMKICVKINEMNFQSMRRINNSPLNEITAKIFNVNDD